MKKSVNNINLQSKNQPIYSLYSTTKPFQDANFGLKTAVLKLSRILIFTSS